MDSAQTEHQRERASRGADDAGRYFQHMAGYVGFTPADAEAIRRTKPIIEKHLPAIVTDFYTHVLRYPTTRRHFLRPDGTVDEAYLVLRMRHLSNFWLRTASGEFDDEYARYLDYVGRAHTSHGADASIYIPERYVIGQVGMVQHAISQAVSSELRDGDDEVEFRAVEAWDKLMMVILDLLARAYGHEREPEEFAAPLPVDQEWVARLARQAIAQEHGELAPSAARRMAVAPAAEVPDGARKIVQVGDLSIGVFHHGGEWYALRNSCIHRGGPVATGPLAGDILTCPWHGYQFDVRTGVCVADPAAELDRYPVTVQEGVVYLDVPATAVGEGVSAVPTVAPPPAAPSQALGQNEFRPTDLAPGQMTTVVVAGAVVAVYNVAGTFYATDDACTHADGPLSEGELDGAKVTCPWHGSCFDVTTGAVLCGPATAPVKTYRVLTDGDVARVMATDKSEPQMNADKNR